MHHPFSALQSAEPDGNRRGRSLSPVKIRSNRPKKQNNADFWPKIKVFCHFLTFFDVFGPFLTIFRQKIAFLGPSSIIAEILEIQINSRREMINIAPPSRRFGVRWLDAAFTEFTDGFSCSSFHDHDSRGRLYLQGFWCSSRSESGICFRMRLTEALLHRRRDHADSPGNYVPSPCTWLSPVLYFFPAASSISTNVPTKIVEELKNGQKVPQNVKKWPKNAQKRLKTAKNSKKWPKIEN
ncbi:MAG TPA: hypothetical protein PKK36_04770, partial [Kiritimatiellia bacterium]|nr:hypothetical protein [Kiritimatiellia bacterium]